MPNIQELVKVFEHIIGNPEEWDQASWGSKIINEQGTGFCGTTYCFAGTAVAMSPKFEIEWDVTKDTEAYMGYGSPYAVEIDTDNEMPIQSAAAVILGLDEDSDDEENDETAYLFGGASCIHVIRNTIETWAREQGEPVRLTIPEDWDCSVHPKSVRRIR